jgi:hypothetical protein
MKKINPKLMIIQNLTFLTNIFNETMKLKNVLKRQNVPSGFGQKALYSLIPFFHS